MMTIDWVYFFFSSTYLTSWGAFSGYCRERIAALRCQALLSYLVPVVLFLCLFLLAPSFLVEKAWMID
jgi:hypothetical protein